MSEKIKNPATKTEQEYFVQGVKFGAKLALNKMIELNESIAVSLQKKTVEPKVEVQKE